MITGLRQLGFSDDDIIVLSEPEWHDLHFVMIDLQGDLQRAQIDGERTLVFCYYAGHGIEEQNMVSCQLNETQLYPLEHTIRKLSKVKGSYIMTLFDCCREMKKETSESAETNPLFASIAGRSSEENFIITYGCPITEGVPSKSQIAKAYIKYLKMSAKEGLIVLPGPLNFFVGTDGKCEHNIKVNNSLLLQWTKDKKQLIKEVVEGENEEEKTPLNVERISTKLKTKISIAEPESEEDDEEDEHEFYDFQEPMKNPDILIQF